MYSALRHCPSIFYKSQPIHLTLFLTRRCNARCPFCFYLKSKSSLENNIDELSLDEIEKISQSMNKLLWLAFSGGEIYLRKDLVEISELFYQRNKPVFMLFPTNGLMPRLIKQQTEKILQRCPNSIIAVKLSIDDLEEKHDTLRNTPNSFIKNIRTYELLGDLVDQYENFELGVNTVFCAQNQDNMRSIIDYVHGMEHISTHTISLVRGNLINEEFKKVDLNKYQQATDYLKHNTRTRQDNVYRFKGARLKAAQDIVQRRLILKTVQQRRRQIPCYAGTTNLVISESGEVYPCEIRTESFGNLRNYDYNLQQVLNTPAGEHIMSSIKNNQCHCTHECNFMTNILLNPRLYPKLMEEYMQIKTD